MIRGLILDVDGTLLDSMEVWDTVAQTYLAQKGIEMDESLSKELACMSLEQSANYLKEKYGLQESVEEIYKGIENCLAIRYENDLQLKDGVKDFIDRCVARNIKLCILSANYATLIESALLRCGILDAFHFIMTCDEVGLDKTNSLLYEKAWKKMNLKKEECMFVEDSLHAIKTIKKAGFFVLAVYDKANKENWKSICEISDTAVMSLSEWRIA